MYKLYKSVKVCGAGRERGVMREREEECNMYKEMSREEDVRKRREEREMSRVEGTGVV